MYHHYPDQTEDGFVGLRYWVPPEHLRNFFGSAYLFTVQWPSYNDLTRADMPQLRFMVSGGGHYVFLDGREAVTPEVCMIGPTMGATRFQLNSPAVVFGTSVLPLGWMALGCESADRWIDRLYDVTTVHGLQFQKTLDMMRAERDPDLIVERLWQFLESQLQSIPDGVIQTVAAIDAWLSDESSPQVERLVTASGLSARQVARTTNRLYGAPPKLLARKYRALRCASQIVIDKKSWVDLCEEGTFYDQPHFIREIKQFIGLTPHQLMNDPTDVARLTVQRRALTGLVAEINRIS